jgi:hypothetical protein
MFPASLEKARQQQEDNLRAVRKLRAKRTSITSRKASNRLAQWDVIAHPKDTPRENLISVPARLRSCPNTISYPVKSTRRRITRRTYSLVEMVMTDHRRLSQPNDNLIQQQMQQWKRPDTF